MTLIESMVPDPNKIENIIKNEPLNIYINFKKNITE